MFVTVEPPPFPRPAPMRLSVPTARVLSNVEVDPEIMEAQGIVGFNSRDARSRPFNLLRAQVLREMRKKEWKLLGISSATPNAGKSFLSVNLAAALAQLPDTEVYLLDFDLRRASLGEKLNLERGMGLTDYLDGSCDDLKQVGRFVSNLGFSIFPCYPARVNSAELLGGERFDALIDGLRALPSSAIVICDLPPAFANDDAMAIIQRLDAYLFVIEEGITTKAEARDSMALFSSSPCLGTVLNRYRPTTVGSYGYGGKYDRYYND
jgi:protein-tyrosine kinase